MALYPHPLTHRYSRFAQTLHWATVVLVLVAFVISVGGPESRVYSAVNDFDRSLHELVGVAVFIITLLRLLWRHFDRPPTNPEMSRWMASASKIVQWTLYALLLLAPLTAILGVWLEGHSLTLLGFSPIAPMIQQSRQLGLLLVYCHGLLGDALIWLAGFHAIAALYHYFWLRDNMLQSMLPWPDETRHAAD